MRCILSFNWKWNHLPSLVVSAVCVVSSTVLDASDSVVAAEETLSVVPVVSAEETLSVVPVVSAEAVVEPATETPY